MTHLDYVLRQLAAQPMPLTPDEITFVRGHFGTIERSKR